MKQYALSDRLDSSRNEAERIETMALERLLGRLPIGSLPVRPAMRVIRTRRQGPRAHIACLAMAAELLKDPSENLVRTGRQRCRRHPHSHPPGLTQGMKEGRASGRGCVDAGPDSCSRFAEDWEKRRETRLKKKKREANPEKSDKRNWKPYKRPYQLIR